MRLLRDPGVNTMVGLIAAVAAFIAIGIGILAIDGRKVWIAVPFFLVAGVIALPLLYGLYELAREALSGRLRGLRIQSPLVFLRGDASETLPAEVATVPDVAFFQSHDALNQSAHSMEAEMKSAKPLWVSAFVGHHFVTAALFTKYPSAVQRLILSDPANTAEVERRVASFRPKSNPLTYIGQIVETTLASLHVDVPIRWWDGPLLPMVIGNPKTPDAWIRIDIPIPETNERPSLVFPRSEYPELVSTMELAFDAQWAASRTPTTKDCDLTQYPRPTADHAIKEQRPMVEWAQSVLDAERRLEFLGIIWYQWRHNHLDDRSPYIEIGVNFWYSGLHPINIGRVLNGRIGLVREYTMMPEVSPLQDLGGGYEAVGEAGTPLTLIRGTTGTVLIRQRLMPEEAQELREALKRGGEVELNTFGLSMSAETDAPLPDQASVYRVIVLGDYCSNIDQSGWRPVRFLTSK